MSTIAYAQLTNTRDEAAPGTSTTTSSPGVKTYVDAFAALVPAEVLTLHALIISTTTRTETVPATGGATSPGTVTTILPEAVQTLEFSFWGLCLLSIALYAIPRYTGGKWDRLDLIRALVAPLAFAGWTMLQRATAFDATFPDFGQIPRTVGALFLGAVLGGVTSVLASRADTKPVKE
jgi:hypothetical protein